MAHQNNVAVVVVQLGDGRVQTALQFVLQGRRRGRQFRVDELRRQLDGRAVGEGGGHDRLFAVHAPLLGQAVAAMGVNEVVLRQVPQPQVKGHGAVAQVVVEPAAGLDQHLLHHIAGIDAGGDGRVEP